MVDKLSKALEGLKNIQFTTVIEDSAVRKKEKMISCVLVADLVVSLKLTSAQNFPQLLSVMVESYIHLCDDKDSDVRMVADENLNRIIRALAESNMLKVLIELHKEIKKNGPARCLRAALWRFGQLSQHIRPNKGRGHVQNLIPCLLVIAKREEESVHETLALSLPNIFKVLGVFTQDNDIKSLLKVFLHNLSSSNAVIRRSSASCIITIVQYCRKPHVFNSFVLNTLLDCVVPICEDNSTYMILGVLNCLRMLLPHLSCDRNDEGLSGSFGSRRKQDESLLSVDRLIQTYELCLHYTKSKDHNVVTAALETLNQILHSPPQHLQTFLLSPAGFSRSYIHLVRDNKLWLRSGSEMSVACSLSGGDENLLFDESEVTSPFASISTSDLPDSKQSSSRLKSKFAFSEEDIKMVDSPYKDKLLGEILGDQPTPDIDSDAESVEPDMNTPSTFLMRVETEEKEQPETEEYLRSNSRDDLSTAVDLETNEEKTVIDVGSFTDTAVPLIYCARHLTASFLLDGTPNSKKSDHSVRVSIKSLVLSCMSAIVKLYPIALKMELAKSRNEDCCQEMSDILLFSEHSDQQIRGGVTILVGSFINAVTLESKGFELDWLSNDNSKLNFNRLLDIIFSGLKDKSSVCCRQALSAFQICLHSVLFSARHQQIYQLLNYLPSMANNSYWLVKVKLVEVLSDLPLVCIHEMTGSSVFQDEIIDSVLLPLLGDEDSRVRLAAAETLVKLIPRLYYENSTVLNYSRNFTEQLKKCLKLKKENNASYNHSSPCSPFSYLFMDNVEYDQDLEKTLSRIVTKLTYSLLTAVNKYSVFGYIEALKLLSLRYPTTIYLKGWNCFKPKSEKNSENDTIASSLLNLILSLLITSPMILDLSAFSSATVLLGNLFAGYSVCNLKNDYQVAVASPTGGPVEFWNVFKNKEMSQIAEQILVHLLKMLNIYSHLLEEVPLSKVASSTATATATALLPLSLPSPIKKQDKKTEKEEKFEDRKPKNFTSYRQTPQYFKLYQLLKNAHTNYKISLETSVSDKFLDLLESTVNALSILLEVGTVHDTGRCAEEILSYLRPVVSLRASSSVICVIQLLKSLFGINLASNWEEIKSAEAEAISYNLFGNVYQISSEFLLERVRSHASSNTLESENLVGTRRRTDRKVIIKNTDKNCLATYIRLFEPMVIKSLKMYTITNDVELQANVLRLLNQLVQLRVNYCLLDADETFVGFVLKQFELIEHGQIPNVEILLPDIFKFLVLLSYEKHHSKNIMSVPKILQLCDGLMASNQPTQTHCIPALIPIVEDVFLSRSLVSSTEQKELETQREVLLAMLLRLVEFHQVMNMLAIILNESRTVEERERWKRWSRQVMDAVLPLASQGRLRTETFEGQNSFSKLMSSLSPNVLRPINPLLNVLFTESHDYNCSVSLKRWLSRVTVMLETILHVKEDVLLSRLEEIAPNINLNTFLPPGKLYSPDPFNVRSFQAFESAETFARFILKVISVTGYTILESISNSSHLQEQLSVFFVCVFHILISGTFHRITNALQALLTGEQESISTICTLFIDMSNISPMLTCQFAYFLALLNYCDRRFWDRILKKPNTLSSKLVQSCGVIALADYLCENLSDVETLTYLLMGNIKEVILFSNETPIKELLTSINRRPTECNLIMQAVSFQNVEMIDGRFIEKLLRILEISDNSQSGPLINLLVKKFLVSKHLALSRLASSLACRRVEFLLTLSPDEVHEQMNKETFNGLMNFINDKKWTKKHSNLIGLLNKLSMQVYDLSPFDMNRSRTIDLQKLKNIQLGEEWFFVQIKERCCQENYPGREMASLLCKLDYERMVEIMYCKKFNVHILKDCLLHRDLQRKRNILLESKQGAADLSPEDLLFKAAKSCLLILVNDLKDRIQRIQTEHRLSQSELLDKIFEDDQLYILIWKIAPSLTVLLNSCHYESCEIGKEHLEAVMELGVLCLEIINWLIEKRGNEIKYELNQNILENGISCSAAVLRSHEIKLLLSQPLNLDKLKLCIRDSFNILNDLIPRCRFTALHGNEESLEKMHAYPEIIQLEFLLQFVMTKSNDALLPSYLKNCFRDLIINLCRVPELSLHILKVPESSDMQDIELLENFISKFSVIGWTSRQQFEEIWVGLLAVLGFNTQGNTPIEETAFIVQASTGAVEGITTLLKNTLLDSVSRKLIHHGRDSSSMKNVINELPLVSNLYQSNQLSDKYYHFLYNLELSESSDKYHHGLLSVEYIWAAVKQINNRIELYEKHSKELNDIGLDLTSCVHLLIELYSQWIYQPSPDIRIITSSLKSSLVISDLFTDISQFQWLLDFCLSIEHIVINEDVVILPMVILGSCKAVSVILPDLEVCDKIKRLMLRTTHNVPCKIAIIQGLLYLLQSPVVSAAVNNTTITQQQEKSTVHSDETNFVTNIVDMFLSVALDIFQQFKVHTLAVQQFKVKTWPMNEDCEKCCWALIFYLLQHYQSSLGESKEEMLNFILTALRNKTSSDSIMSLLVRGIERLLLTSVIEEKFLDQVSKIALEMTSQSSSNIYRNGLQLLMVLSYLDKKTKDIRQLVTGHEDPEKIMRGMEVVNVLFERLKKSYPDEAEVIADVINYVLKDFNAPDILTKVIQEFLSPNQPHLKLLSGLLFKVFERAELSLLQDWVVMTLPSFTQGLPVGMSIWTLNCFFVSASSEPWLRSMFPLVQSRLRMAEVEDKKLLCLAGSHFYNQLNDEKQKKLFISTFENAAKTFNVFNELLSLLR